MQVSVYHHGCVYFRTASADKRRPMGDPYFGQVDAFAVYCRQLDASSLIPVEDVQTRQIAALRVDTPANGQYSRVRWALPYLLGRAAGQLFVPSELERKTGFEPATYSLARNRATTAPLPLDPSDDI
jgi:PD-(D/E)XK endonuclease